MITNRLEVVNGAISINKVFIVAEIGINHNGDLNICKKMIQAAKRAGADAVKLQTIVADTLYSIYSWSYSEKKPLLKDTSLIDFFDKFSFSKQQYIELFDFAKEQDIELFSTPFDNDSADMLEELGVNYYKIASSDLTNINLLEHIAKKRKPVMLSTGMSTIEDIDAAVDILEQHSTPLALLYCVSLYPLPDEYIHLERIRTLQDRYPYVTGFSDHSKDYFAATGAVFMGVRIIEKHFTHSYEYNAPDREVSLDEHDLKTMVSDIRRVETVLGEAEWNISSEEKNIAELSRRSIYAKNDLETGHTLTLEDMAFKRPNRGTGAERYKEYLGKKVRVPLDKDQLILPDNLI